MGGRKEAWPFMWDEAIWGLRGGIVATALAYACIVYASRTHIILVRQMT